MGLGLSSQAASDRRGEHSLKAAPGEAQVGHQEEFLHGKCGQALEGVPGMTGCGTRCSGLVHRVWISPRFDLMISEVYSNLNDSGSL